MSPDLASRFASLRAARPDLPAVITRGARRFVLFLSWTDGMRRAEVASVVGSSAANAWERAEAELRARGAEGCWLRADWADAAERTTWGELRDRLARIKRNYVRVGIALDAEFDHAFLETELNANAMLYGGPGQPSACLNERNFRLYAAKRHGLKTLSFADERAVWLFTTKGLFAGDDGTVHPLGGAGLDAGRRMLSRLGPDELWQLVNDGSRYLASQVQADGRFHYGWHPCFDRPIGTYNNLRHASSLYAMLEAWEVTRDADLGAAIDRALACLTRDLIRAIDLPGGERAAFLVEANDEIKLGGNAVAIIALVKHRHLTGDARHAALLNALGAGILHMQDAATGCFDHVLTYPQLALKERFRTIYYDGEAAFALMRLYGLTREARWLAAVEHAFGHFIRARHWTAHDHWLGYCVNELTMHRPKDAWFRFGLDNIRDHLGFVEERITTFPTLLELMMAAEKMIDRLRADPAREPMLEGLDIARFYRALHHRAAYLLNGHFWPELAMFFAAPRKMAGSFFIRHHAFRVRIDDVEHYLSGLIAYRNYLLECEARGGFAHETPSLAPRAQRWTAADVARATGGRWAAPPPPAWSASGLCIAPVTMRPADMVAVRFAEGEVGIARGRLAQLAHPPAACLVGPAGAEMDLGTSRLAVDDLNRAILALGEYARRQMRGKVLAVTGSAGKTTAVAMLGHALAAYGPVGQTRHNANLPHGIAWNLASIPWDTPHIVLELAIGRMARNTRLARPDIALFTNILPAHLEYHRNLATVAARKSVIFAGMQPGGVTVLNREMAEWSRVHMAARERGLDILHYGISRGCDFRLLDQDPVSGRVFAEIDGRKVDYVLGAPGRHMALNSLAVLAAVASAGHELDAAMASLAHFRPLDGRGASKQLRLGARRITLIDEAYNANPGSMAAALSLLAQARGSGRKIAVLGEMRELGPEAAAYHRALAPLVVASGVDRVHAVGPLYADFWHAIPAERRGFRVDAPEALKADLLSDLDDGDLLLLKGSHGSLIYELVDWLKQLAAAQAGGAGARSAPETGAKMAGGADA
ncbi:Mur ligase family protein [Sphingopyxis sp. 113P3]|uniref:Mur ligase family protein n=1 Tax=Sphingopyxis sp. (strain 113P3) TaxID=292913 RepID=UPI0006BC958A|nr:Mur ligase family protein [Sphingopyxis sp. 113P3]ALC13387.1 UDP-N-acetylmuramoyl-tripeptide--D-alanyl-D-alanine ligase [Sphingopyxis sp. 113P3]